ncbi:hypothetical protein HZR84_02720 [Hyphobacterium sp. CCMP332]|nr:hypothetical protein HZR84_02720 [Hyphobacterium sp. CCMP332]
MIVLNIKQYKLSVIKLDVKISPEHRVEKEYIFKTIIGDFLDLEYEIHLDHNIDSYVVNAGNGKVLTINNVLFKNESYLKAELIPNSVGRKRLSIEEEEFDLAVLYGNDSIEISSDQIYLGIDIIGSAFFMLSRMEELLVDALDAHERFPASASLAVKENFYKIPVVDVYARFLNFCLNKLNPNISIKKKEVKIVPSHDLDHLSKLDNLRSIGGAVKRGLFRASSLKHSSHYLKEYLNRKNPFDQIQNLVKMSEAVNSFASFYFLVGRKSKYDSGHFDKYKKEAEKYKYEIISGGHNIGLHPSYSSGQNISELINEKKKLEDWLGDSVIESRQHYLRVKVPETFQNLETVGIKTDSSIAYPEFPGFRSGTSYEYQVFDLSSKKCLDLKERPLIAMDTSLINDKSKTISEKFQEIEEIKSQIKVNGGNWSFLIHNSNFFWLDEEEYFELWQSFYKI